MNGLSEAGAIVGIIGRAIASASALYTFCQTYRHVELDIERISDEVERLKVILFQLERLLPNLSATACAALYIRTAEVQIHDCKTDLADWSQKIDGMDLKNAKATKKIKEKLKIAADKGFFRFIHTRICSHREQLTFLATILTADIGSRSLLSSRLELDSLDALRDDQTNIRDETFQRLDMIRRQITSISEEPTHFRDIHRKVDDIHSLSFHRHEANQSSLESIDTRLKRMEQELRQSFQASQRHRHSRNGKKIGKAARVNLLVRSPKAEPHETNNQTLVRASKLPSTTTFRIIKPGYLFYDEDGETKMDLVGLKDAKFANADNKSKLQMIEYLKNLRLVLWLLKKQNYFSYTEHVLTRVFKSGLASQASLTSKWLCSISCEYLIDILPERAEMLGTLLPWSMRKDWLQHIFDSMEDRDKDGEMIMELVVSRWLYFPLPEGDRAEYYLRVPPSLEIGEFSQYLAVNGACGSSRDEPFQDIIEVQSLADENLEAQTYPSEPRLPGSVIHSSNYSLRDSQGFPMPQTAAFTSANCYINLPSSWEDEVGQFTALNGSHQQETHELLNRTRTQIVEALARSSTEASTGETKTWSTDSELVEKRSRLRPKTESSDKEDVEAPWPRLRFRCYYSDRGSHPLLFRRANLRTREFTRHQLCHAEMALPPNKQSSKCAGCVETARRLEFKMRSRAQNSCRISAKQVR